MLFHDNLEDIIFNKHLTLDVDELIILSGYVGPQPIAKLKDLPLQCSVIYGMYGANSIGQKLHSTLQKLNNDITNLNIMYSQLPVHTKCYVWKKNQNIVTALVGSANFSTSGLCNPYREILAETTKDTFNPLNKYLDFVINKSISCHDDSIIIKTQNLSPIITQSLETPLFCKLSLLDNSGNVQLKSGLNWGLSEAHTKEGDAYIAIRTEYIKNYPLLFPPKQSKPLSIHGGRSFRQNDSVDLIWDDGIIMEGLLEGSQPVGGIRYPKQLCSSPNKNILGIYLRQRLGVSLDHLITKEDLLRYGRTDIEISLQGEGVYYLDFSV